MSRYNVEYNGKWACFSSIVDDFITEFMSKLDYEEWREFEYGKNLRPLEFNIKTIERCAFSIRLNRTPEEAMKCLIQCGLSKSECEQIMYDMETKYYCPKPKDNGKFECPNCHREIEPGQIKCNNDTCEIDFIWR